MQFLSDLKVQSTFSYATTRGAPQSGRLWEVVIYKKNQENMCSNWTD